MPSRRHRRQTGPLYRAIYQSVCNLESTVNSYTRRRLGGRQPLCGIGVTSRIERTSRPAVCRARIADSRPEPGPLTSTSHERMPNALAALVALSAACVAANGVPLREPLKPIAPALDHDTTAPSASVIVISVLLNDACKCTKPWWTMRFSPRFLNAFFFLVGASAPPPCCSALAIIRYTVCFLATAPLRGPFRVRALVLVRWPR